MIKGETPTVPDVRVRIFVDFWNFQLEMRNRLGPDFQLNWQQLGPWLAKKAGQLLVESERIGIIRYDGLHVYLSYNPNTQSDAKFRNWAHTVLDRFPGVEVIARERKTKHPPKCPSCHAEITKCPARGATTIGTVEKGIDTAIVTDIIRLAWEDSYDLAVLISSDRDFIPAVEYLNAKGRKVIHAGFPPKGFELAKKCWASMDLGGSLCEIERPATNGPPSVRYR
jgi:hypothetical protein